MIQRIAIEPRQIRDYTAVNLNAGGNMNGFPFFSVDEESYIVEAEIQSGINFRVENGCHCLAIGKCCSLADKITFMVDLNHDYAAVTQGEWTFLQDVNIPVRIRRKGSIILQNDVWVGHGVTIMSGVTLHNGCVIAAGSVVTKDVPPYAIVGGSPARVLHYRFDETLIHALQKIAFWDWPGDVKEARKNDFALPPEAFAAKYLPEAENSFTSLCSFQRENDHTVVLFIPDLFEPYPLYPKVFRNFFAKDRPNCELLIYLSKDASGGKNLTLIENMLAEYEERDCEVTIQSGEDLDERALIEYADYYVTTRARQTVKRTCLCDLYHTKVLYGTDDTLFDWEDERV